MTEKDAEALPKLVEGHGYRDNDDQDNDGQVSSGLINQQIVTEKQVGNNPSVSNNLGDFESFVDINDLQDRFKNLKNENTKLMVVEALRQENEQLRLALREKDILIQEQKLELIQLKKMLKYDLNPKKMVKKAKDAIHEKDEQLLDTNIEQTNPQLSEKIDDECAQERKGRLDAKNINEIFCIEDLRHHLEQFKCEQKKIKKQRAQAFNRKILKQSHDTADSVSTYLETGQIDSTMKSEEDKILFTHRKIIRKRQSADIPQIKRSDSSIRLGKELKEMVEQSERKRILKLNLKIQEQHVKQIEEDEGKYHRRPKCKKCGRCFKNYYQMGMHDRKKHCEEVVQCHKCGTNFLTLEDCKEHKELFDKKPCVLECNKDDCKQTFDKKYKLDDHLDAKHWNFEPYSFTYKMYSNTNRAKTMGSKELGRCIDLLRAQNPQISKNHAKKFMNSQEGSFLLQYDGQTLVGIAMYKDIRKKNLNFQNLWYQCNADGYEESQAHLLQRFIKNSLNKKYCEIYVSTTKDCGKLYHDNGFTYMASYEINSKKIQELEKHPDGAYFHLRSENFLNDRWNKIVFPKQKGFTYQKAQDTLELMEYLRNSGIGQKIRQDFQDDLKFLDTQFQNIGVEKDQAGSPKPIFTYLVNMLGTGMNLINDPCPMVPGFDPEIHYNALVDGLASGINYSNHPFSKSQFFLRFYFVEWLYNKKNITTLTTQQCAEIKYFIAYMDEWVNVFKRPAYSFDKHSETLKDGLAIINFFQPKLIDLLEKRKDQIKKRETDPNQIVDKIHIEDPMDEKELKVDECCRLLALGKTREQIRPILHIGTETFQNWKKFLYPKWKLNKVQLPQ